MGHIAEALEIGLFQAQDLIPLHKLIGYALAISPYYVKFIINNIRKSKDNQDNTKMVSST